MKGILIVLLIFITSISWSQIYDKEWHESKIDMVKVELGKKLFRRKACKGCHVIGNFENKKLRGPDLMDVTARRTKAWLEGWIKDPRVYLKNKDPIIMKLLKQYPTKMPYLKLKPEQVEGLLEYIRYESLEAKKQHQKKK